MVSKAMKCGKYVFFVLNLILFVAGIALIVAGVLVQSKFNDYFAFFSGKVNYASLFIIVVGVIIFWVAFFGCCGSFKENRTMMIVYMIMVVLVIILEIALVVAAHFNSAQIEDKMASKMRETIPKYDLSNHEQGIGFTWDKLQKTLKCCGVQIISDWYDGNSQMEYLQTVPDSCCIEPSVGCGKVGNHSLTSEYVKDTYNIQGCAPALKMKFKDNEIIIIGVISGLAVLKLIMAIHAALLAKAFSKEYQTVQ
ncbi:hypothetical protein HELRODRAFT_185361 [Helobdella robusta]|uniref:Tetraspanin n=1 Tax=Helobdella robusta TaxID=6412 RepID=T1FMQ3_HELRO|nr:hypothetical protein HELRODRAFT_185361 [Helobdella robusta]ESO09549.1 hypothetical protein HELRODRAFT_185361 [Helobdella robusta]